MSIEKIVKIKLKELKKEYNKIIKENKQEKYKIQLDNINYVLENIKESKIIDINTNILEKVLENLSKNQLEENISLFKNIKLIMTAKYKQKLNIELTENQNKYLNNIENKLLELKNKIEEKLNLNKEIDYTIIENLEDLIIEFEYLLEKITDNKKELLDENDFNLLYENIIEDETKDYETKKNLLIEIKKYNSHLEKENKVSIEDIIDLFKKYNLEDLIKITNSNKEIVKSRAHIHNMEEIIKFFDDKNLLKRFNLDCLFTILLFGDIDFIREREELIKTNPVHKMLFYKTPSFWINNIKTRRIKRGKTTGTISSPGNIYINAAYDISYEEFLENEAFLKALGFNVSSNNETNMKTLKTPNHKLRENLDYYKLYKVLDELHPEEFPTSALSFSRVDDKCDMFIELGLLHGSSNYLKKSPTAINTFSDEVIQLLYKLKKETTEEEYYNAIMSKYKKGSVKTQVYINKFGYNLKTNEEKEKFFAENFFDYKAVIPKSEYYEEIITNEISSEINQEILNDDYIINLESNHKVNEYIYKFDNQIISRYKVLRCLTALKKHNINITKENLLYCILRNSYIDEKTFNIIANSIGYSIGEMHK